MEKYNKALSLEDKKSLFKRYLWWLYKTTKEELDKIERKFTQLEIDRQLEVLLLKKIKGEDAWLRDGLGPYIEEWKKYIAAKETDAHSLKFTPKNELNFNYIFLLLKLEAISEIIKARFGCRLLREMKRFCEKSAIKRILEDTSGH